MKILAVLLFMIHTSQQPLVIFEVTKDGFDIRWQDKYLTENQALFEVYSYSNNALLKRKFILKDTYKKI